MELNDRDCARIALYLEDPYGDGIRLESIRNPRPERVATLEFVATGQRSVDGLEDGHIALGRAYTKSLKNVVFLQQQGLL
jgi:hypothetical protein